MILTIELSTQEEAWITARAEQEALPPSDVVKRLIDRHLLPDTLEERSKEANTSIVARNAAAIAYLDARIKADATDDPAEIRKAEEELKELKRNLNANRAATGERLVFP